MLSINSNMLKQTKAWKTLSQPSTLGNFHVAATKVAQVVKHPANVEVPKLAHTQIGKIFLGNLENTKLSQSLGHLSEVKFPQLQDTKIGKSIINLFTNIKI